MKHYLCGCRAAGRRNIAGQAASVGETGRYQNFWYYCTVDPFVGEL